MKFCGSIGWIVFERRSRSDCVHEQAAKRIANVRYTADQHSRFRAVGKMIIFAICRKVCRKYRWLCLVQVKMDKTGKEEI